jgi:hypothetical protein
VAPLELTAITNFIWASELFLFAGLLLGQRWPHDSAAFLWALVMLAMGVSAFIGGIDHGFFEPKGESASRVVVQKATWIAIGGLTVLIVLAVARQFAPPAWFRYIVCLGLVHFAVFVVAALRARTFAVVVINYSPVIVTMLVLNVAGTRHGSGSWQMTLGVVLSGVATLAEALGVHILSPIDRNGLYHIILMVAAVFLFLGGFRLKRQR